MARDARICPSCQSESEPWVVHAGVWWVKGNSGAWQWLDPKANVWWWYEDGTPSSPSTTSLKPTLPINPSTTPPPDTTAIEVAPATAVATDSQVGDHDPVSTVPGESLMAADLERLADLHARGELTDEEFTLAKARLLGASGRGP